MQVCAGTAEGWTMAACLCSAVKIFWQSARDGTVDSVSRVLKRSCDLAFWMKLWPLHGQTAK